MIKKILSVGLILLVFFSGYIRWAQTAKYQFPLTFDQSRDLLDIRLPGTFTHFPVMGPTTSINGLYLGPGYYYFNLIPFWIGKGNPQALVFWNILWFLLCGLSIFVFFYKRNFYLGFLVSIFYLFAPQLFDTTRYFWNAHSMIYAMVLYFLTMWNFKENQSTKNALLWALASGFVMQFEAAMGVIAVGFSLLSIILSRKFNFFKLYLVGLLPWFAPQIAAEVFKNFRMTKLLFEEFANPVMLGDKLTLVQTFWSHFNTINKYWEGQFILNFGWGFYILLLAIISGILVKKYRQYMLYFLGYLFFTFIFYMLFYRHDLKIWYAESLRVWYVFVVGIGVVSTYELIKNKSVNKFAMILGFIFLSRNIWLTYIDQRQFINNPNFAKDDPKLASHEIAAVDWVFHKMNGQGFKAFNYVPEIYDYPYQYIYWWYGRSKFGYMPGLVTYEVGVPTYINRQNDFYQSAKDSNKMIALIYERKSNYFDWLGKYAKYCIKDKIDFEWNVSAEIRELCAK